MARRGNRSSCQFASATASLSEGVMSKPNVSFSPPPPKPKVNVMVLAATDIRLQMTQNQHPPALAAPALFTHALSEESRKVKCQ